MARAQGLWARVIVSSHAVKNRARDVSNDPFANGWTEPEDDNELLLLLAKAAIRHEDTLNVIRRSRGWVFWIRAGDNSILPMLAELADQWHKVALSPNIPASRVSLRVTPLWGILTHLKEKLEHLTEAEKAFAIQSGWMTETHSWNFQRWNSTHQALVVDTGRPPLSMTQAMESLTHMLKTINGDTVTRFAATQDLRQEIRGTVTFSGRHQLPSTGVRRSICRAGSPSRISPLRREKHRPLRKSEPDSADPPSLAPSAVLGSAEAEYMDDGESVHSLADTIHGSWLEFKFRSHFSSIQLATGSHSATGRTSGI